jgi:hypothetical protein
VNVGINPQKIKGYWSEEYALDLHTTGSTLLGYDAFGNPQFDTSRIPLGELLYQLKYRSDSKRLIRRNLRTSPWWFRRFQNNVPSSPTSPRRRPSWMD